MPASLFWSPKLDPALPCWALLCRRFAAGFGKALASFSRLHMVGVQLSWVKLRATWPAGEAIESNILRPRRRRRVGSHNKCSTLCATSAEAGIQRDVFV
jgi:hypothetical protein